MFKRMVRGEAGRISRVFDLTVQGMILVSVVTLTLLTMSSLPPGLRAVLRGVEAFSLAFFLVEYGLRIHAAERKLDYLFSFWGIIDFLAIVPALIFMSANTEAFRAVRFLRIVRIVKLGRYSAALVRLQRALAKVVPEFAVFSFLCLIVFFIAATGIYFFEREAQPGAFPSIPAAMWWAVATLTTVGYGDLYPITVGGKLFTSIIVMIGLGLVSVPAGLLATALQDVDDDQSAPPA